MVHGYPLRAVTGFHLEHRAKWRRQGFHPGWASRCRINLHVAPVSLSERRLRSQYTWNKDVTALYKLQLRLKYSSEESNFLREQVNQSLQGAETQRLSDLCKFILGVSGEPGLDWGDLLFLAAWLPPAFFTRGQCTPFHGIRQVGENVDSQGNSSSHSPFSAVGGFVPFPSGPKEREMSSGASVTSDVSTFQVFIHLALYKRYLGKIDVPITCLFVSFPVTVCEMLCCYYLRILWMFPRLEELCCHNVSFLFIQWD